MIFTFASNVESMESNFLGFSLPFRSIRVVMLSKYFRRLASCFLGPSHVGSKTCNQTAAMHKKTNKKNKSPDRCMEVLHHDGPTDRPTTYTSNNNNFGHALTISPSPFLSFSLNLLTLPPSFSIDKPRKKPTRYIINIGGEIISKGTKS